VRERDVLNYVPMKGYRWNSRYDFTSGTDFEQLFCRMTEEKYLLDADVLKYLFNATHLLDTASKIRDRLTIIWLRIQKILDELDNPKPVLALKQ
jgi:hypothetical protein